MCTSKLMHIGVIPYLQEEREGGKGTERREKGGVCHVGAGADGEERRKVDGASEEQDWGGG